MNYIEKREAITKYKNVEKVETNDHSSVYFYKNSQEKPCAVGFVEKRGKAAFIHSFTNDDQRSSWVNDWMSRMNRCYSERAERKEAERLERFEGSREFAKSVKVGDVFISTISYTMTLNKFFQVVAVTGTKKIKVIRIDAEWVSGDRGWQGHVRPMRKDTCDASEILEATVTGKGRVCVGRDAAYQTTWEATHYENHLD